MLSFNVSDIDQFTQFQVVDGCEAKPRINPGDYGMAFDSNWIDYVFNFASELSTGVIVSYLTYTLMSQKDESKSRYINIEKQEINVNSISEDELKQKIERIVEDKIKSLDK